MRMAMLEERMAALPFQQDHCRLTPMPIGSLLGGIDPALNG
jgi:hypothetical protein